MPFYPTYTICPFCYSDVRKFNLTAWPYCSLFCRDLGRIFATRREHNHLVPGGMRFI